MKYSTKLSDTVHVMVLIAINQEKSLSSASIAESVHTNPGFVRQLMLNVNYSATELPEHLKSGGIPPFSGCVHNTNTARHSAMQLLLLFLVFLVRLRTVPSVFRIRKDISAGY